MRKEDRRTRRGASVNRFTGIGQEIVFADIDLIKAQVLSQIVR